MPFSTEEETRVQRIEIEQEKLNMKQEFTKQWVEEQAKLFISSQADHKKEVQDIKSIIQGNRQSPGLLEEIRNLKKQIKIYGILISCLFAGSELGVFSQIVQTLVK